MLPGEYVLLLLLLLQTRYLCCLQDIALIDARRGATMFRNVRVPILGIIENMSYYQCPSCGQQQHIFGRDGAKRTAEDFNMELLGQVLSCPMPDDHLPVCSGMTGTAL